MGCAKAVHFFRLTRMALAATLCLWAGQAPADTASTKPHPPPGSPDPGPPCQREGAPPWLGFFCKFMTVDLWKAAGRPTFTAPDGTHWQPWYYGDQADRGNNLLYEGHPYRPGHEGFLEAMLKTDKLPDEYDPAYVSRFWSLFRYTPWSVYFENKAGCNDRQIANPYDFAAKWNLTERFPRSQLLGLGWREAAKDSNDPTAKLGDAGMLELMSAANLGSIISDGQRIRIRKRYTLRDEVNAMARGKGELRPDYARDGEVWLVNGDGAGARIDDLDTAAAYVAGTGVLFANENHNTWQDGYDAAKKLAARTKRSLVYIYFAQDIFYPVNNNELFRRRLQYLLDRAVDVASRNDLHILMISVGRSAPIFLHAGIHRDGVGQLLLRPVPGPWGLAEYESSIVGAKHRVKIVAGDSDFVSLMGGGIEFKSKIQLCLSGSASGFYLKPGDDALDKSIRRINLRNLPPVVQMPMF